MEMSLKQIKKRNGEIVPFDKTKIADAIFKSAQSIGGTDRTRSEYLADVVANKLEAK